MQRINSLATSEAPTEGVKSEIKRSSANYLFTFLGIIAIICLVTIISFSNGMWILYPTGNDALGHLTQTLAVYLYWPHSDWGYFWAAGMPLFRWYGFVWAYMIAFLAKLTGFNLDFSFIIVFLASIATTGIASYLIVNDLTENDRIASLIAAIITVTYGPIWGFGVGGGMYPRVIGLLPYSVFLYFLLKYLKQSSEGQPKFRTYLAAALTFSIAIASYVLVAAAAGLALIIMPIVCLKKWKQKIATSLKIVIPFLLLSAYFALPLIISNVGEGLITGSIGVAGQNPQILKSYDLNILISGTIAYLEQFNQLTLPLLAILIILAVVKIKWGSYPNNDAFWKEVVKAAAIASIILIVFVWTGADVFFTSFTVSFLPLICGILLHYVFNIQEASRHFRLKRNVYKIVKVSVLLLITASTLMATPPYGRSIKTFSLTTIRKPLEPYPELTQKLLENESGTRILNQRFGIPDDSVGQWFNYLYPNVPQTRQYEATAIVDKDVIYWFELAAWGGDIAGEYYPGTYQETNFLLDWFGVKWFAVYPPYNLDKFLPAPQFYELVYKREPTYGFIYKDASPIISPTKVPNALLIGSANVFRCFAYADYDSKHIIPILGGAFIDDFTLEELSKFNSIILYGYNYHDFEKSWGLLQKYVENGGGLIIETGYSPEISASSIPLPSPVENTIKTDFGKEWSFKNVNSPITDGVDFQAFSPAVYDSGPWGVSTTRNESLRNWAKPVLWDSGHPLVVMGEYGKGRVVWSGLNLPEHISEYRNLQEALFLSKMVDWVSESNRTSLGDSSKYVVDRPNPEKVVVTLQDNFSGVLFKEFKIDNWKAYLEDSSGRRLNLEIYPAGPKFMYALIPEVTLPSKVIFEYGWSNIEYIGNLTSLTTLSLLMLYGFRQNQVRAVLEKHVFSIFRNFKKKLKDYWYEEG